MNNEELNPSKAYVVLSWLLAVSFRTVKNLCLSAESCQALAQNPAALRAKPVTENKRLGKSQAVFNLSKIAFGYNKHSYKLKAISCKQKAKGKSLKGF